MGEDVLFSAVLEAYRPRPHEQPLNRKVGNAIWVGGPLPIQPGDVLRLRGTPAEMEGMPPTLQLELLREGKLEGSFAVASRLTLRPKETKSVEVGAAGK